MTTIVQHTQGLSLLVRINWDRLFYGAAIVLALWAGSVAGTFLMQG
jgi:hypothetical protein